MTERQRRCEESASSFEQNARHHDFQEIEVENVAVDTPGPIHDPGNQKQVENDLCVGLRGIA